ncbi:MAG: LCP family protein [Patescibacteria group bacterium]|jgi:LCP family protein required for cell wall assembly
MRQPQAAKDGGRQHGKQLDRFRIAPSRMRLVFLAFGVLVLVGVVWFGYSAARAFNKISEGSDRSSPILQFFGRDVDPNALAGEGDGRINVLLIGIGGASHKGGALADTVMVASIDPQNKQVALLSLPRDLRVPIAGNGYGKLNSAHSYGEAKEKGTGPKVLKETVADILDLPIHYYVRIDFDGFEKFIDALGGITVDVKKALNDPYYPDDRLEGYQPFTVRAGVQEMDGDTALRYARSRQTTSDFDRAARQQDILLAIQQKALSVNVLANPQKLTSIMNVVGDHIRMDLSAQDLQRLFSLVKDLGRDDVTTTVIDNSADGPLKTVNDGGYYLVPKSGDFKEVQRIAHSVFTDPYIRKEAAGIEVLNGTGMVGVARELELDLKSRGYNVVNIDNTPTVTTTTIYDYSAGAAPFTARLLSERLSTQLTPATRPVDAEPTVQFRVVLGSSYKGTE